MNARAIRAVLSRRSFRCWLRCVVASAAIAGSAAVLAQSPPKPESAAPFVATPTAIVDEMLALAAVGPGDFVVDLGSGDGRLVISAVTRYKARGGFGVDIDPALVKLANDNARSAGVSDRVQFFERDLFKTDVSEATVVTLYLLPKVMGRVEKKLFAELKPGTRIVAHDYEFPGIAPEKLVELDALDKLRIAGTTYTRLWLYRVPERR